VIGCRPRRQGGRARSRSPAASSAASTSAWRWSATPELLFLDEPTTGFDPSARRQAWEVIAGLRDLGKTVFLTTHYMDEAQRLADRVAIIAAADRRRGAPEALGDREHQPPRSLRRRRRAAGSTAPGSRRTAGHRLAADGSRSGPSTS
jgi:energy-coupling factor transporter ATP-binding protein EcfA2